MVLNNLTGRKGVRIKMKWLHILSYSLVWVGALNWGLVGLFDFNLVAALLPGVEKLVYILVGAAAVYTFATHKNACKACAEMMK